MNAVNRGEGAVEIRVCAFETGSRHFQGPRCSSRILPFAGAATVVRGKSVAMFSLFGPGAAEDRRDRENQDFDVEP
ncbi:MAG: hypothetical protein ACREE6_12835, partial [Limisphaerales bacterium]